MDQPHLKEQLRALPTRPGVYLMKDASGAVLYVGKAASLRSRVRSYFGAGSDLSPKVGKLMARVADLEYILTDSPAEALILECNLIKRHKPRYNVRLKDDKSYPYLKVNTAEEWPRVYVTRRFENDGARYFGPFASASSVRRTMDLVKKLFPYRSCTRSISGKDPRPCLDYYIHRCVGPCIGAASGEEYWRVIEQVILFLEGKQEQVVKELKQKMLEASAKLEFERAAVLRDQVRAIERTIEHQKISSTSRGDEDVIAFARGQDETCVQVFFVRGGKVMGREHFILEGTQDESPASIMGGFLLQFYDSAPSVPPTILLQHPPQDQEAVRQWLSHKRGERVSLQVPRRGEKKALVELVAENAASELQQLRIRWLADSDKTLAAVEELQEYLSLSVLPKRIECYDISNIQGSNAVGSMVVFENGQPNPPHYRRFRIKSVVGANDYAMMREVLRRRFKRGTDWEKYRPPPQGDGPEPSGEEPLDPSGRGLTQGPRREAWALLPDLVIVDGGKGQLNAALQAMAELGCDHIPTVGLAKEQEEIFLPGLEESILLPRTSQSLYLVQRIRDEAHRFAITYHRKLRGKAAVESALDTIPGIGPKRRRALLKAFGSVRGIQEASLDDLAAVVGMTRSLAARVKEHL